MSTVKPTIRGKTMQPEPKVTTNLLIAEEDAATGFVAEAYADNRTRFGRQRVPGILKCFPNHPPLLEQMIELASSLLFVEGHLTRATKEMIATYVSAINACPYCLDSHASFVQQGGSDELLTALSRGDIESSSINTKERRLLIFVSTLTIESHRIAPISYFQLSSRRRPKGLPGPGCP